MKKEYYVRNLPHIQPEEGVFFITFRLAGSLPKEVMEQLTLERNLLRESILQPDLNKESELNLKLPHIISKDHLFEKFDNLLDNPTSGPVWLKNPKIASIIKASIHKLDGTDYKLICYTIMANHVHLIIYKCQRPLFKILQSLKRFTAKEANIVIGREGKFWHKESYDNLVRDLNDLAVKINYVIQNPVKAGLVRNWEAHEFTFCNEKFLKYL